MSDSQALSIHVLSNLMKFQESNCSEFIELEVKSDNAAAQYNV